MRTLRKNILKGQEVNKKTHTENLYVRSECSFTLKLFGAQDYFFIFFQAYMRGADVCINFPYLYLLTIACGVRFVGHN